MIREQGKDQSKQWYNNCADTLNNRNVKINLYIIVFVHPASDMNG